MKKNILITGASRGIGRAIAYAFAKEGYTLYLTCIHSKDILENLKIELENTYAISCHIFIGDMGDFSFVSSLFRSIPHLDVLVNNAGISHIGLLSDLTVEEWQKIMSVNLDSCFYTCKLAVPGMVYLKQGKIINISSIWGNVGASMEVAYSTSKGAINAFTKALAKELAPSNVQVNAISCGIIDTQMNACFSPEEKALLIEEIPANRFGTPSEVAHMVLQLANSPTYLTGQIITFDGGYL